MNALVVLMLFAGLAMVMHAIYEERYRRLRDEVRIEYRFIPRTLYEDQLAQTDVGGMFKNMFEEGAPWPGEATTTLSRGPPKSGAA